MTAAPRYPLEGVASWNMNTTCNYRCSYCTQRFVDDRAQWARDLPRFVAAFVALPGDWEIKLSGGGPVRHPQSRCPFFLRIEKGGPSLHGCDLCRRGCMLVFGKETAGLPDDLLAREADRTIRIPMLDPMRSLNLANAVSVVSYELIRQLGKPDVTDPTD